MLKLVPISDPKIPGSLSHSIVRNDDQERRLREQLARQRLVGGEAHEIKPTGDFFRLIDYINRK
jgi:hypothetical protein